MAVTFTTKVGPKKGYDKYGHHLDSKPIKATVDTTKKSGKVEGATDTYTVELHKGVTIPKEELYQLTVDGGQTLNLGNYESVRIGVRLQMPTTKGDLEASYEWATDWIGAKIQQCVKDAKGL